MDSLFSQKFVELAPEKNKAQKLLDNVLKHYSEPHRFYHNVSHLENGLRIYFGLFDHIDRHTFYAWAYHDIWYMPLSKYNEERSAHMLYTDAQVLGLDERETDWAVDMVMATKLNSENWTVVNDMDLSVFGQPADIYNLYRTNIRAEYPLISDETFRAGRLHVLKQLTQRKPFFKRREFQELYGAQAEMNLLSEITELQMLG